MRHIWTFVFLPFIVAMHSVMSGGVFVAVRQSMMDELHFMCFVIVVLTSLIEDVCSFLRIGRRKCLLEGIPGCDRAESSLHVGVDDL